MGTCQTVSSDVCLQKCTWIAQRTTTLVTIFIIIVSHGVRSAKYVPVSLLNMVSRILGPFIPRYIDFIDWICTTARAKTAISVSNGIFRPTDKNGVLAVSLDVRLQKCTHATLTNIRNNVSLPFVIDLGCAGERITDRSVVKWSGSSPTNMPFDVHKK